MNVGGKILLGLTIVLAITDAYLVTVLHGHRAKWQKQIEDRQGQLAQVETQLQDVSRKYREGAGELARIQTEWGRYLNVPQGRTLNAEQGTLAIAAGAVAGLPEPVADKPFPIRYVFTNEADGTTRYIGEFNLRDVQADQSGLQLTQQPPTPTGITALQQLQGQTLRVRDSIPAAHRGLFDDYFARHALINQRLTFQANQLAIQSEELAKSEAILAQRMAELNGDQQPPEGASEQVVNGLVVTIRDQESSRNSELQELDRLRHEFARKTAQLEGLVRENQQSVSRLPGYEESLAKPEPRTASK
ncbi:MAG: hypothetical protein JNG89_16515 [Planctomycetaceae bacterium]|nr:hypothetical protein [Planctomycetaceae bacterium]